MYWRYTVEFFNVVFFQVFDFFEDCFTVFIFEFIFSIKHGDIHKSSISIVNKYVYLLDHTSDKRAGFFRAGQSNNTNGQLFSIVRPFRSSHVNSHPGQRRSIPVILLKTNSMTRTIDCTTRRQLTPTIDITYPLLFYQCSRQQFFSILQ